MEDTLFSVWDQLLLAQFCDTWFAMQRCGGEPFPLIAMGAVSCEAVVLSGCGAL